MRICKLIPILSADALPNLMKCMKIASTIPVSTADCQRSSSALKLVKTFLRDKISTGDLGALYISKQRCKILENLSIIDPSALKTDHAINSVLPFSE
uniref:Uncharacterized protein n=1 Tax=Romanomermis culicivorax TaxID=13658 RepID=A0A915IKK1_ROMCU